jgi:type VI protein secretion system component VasK
MLTLLIFATFICIVIGLVALCLLVKLLSPLFFPSKDEFSAHDDVWVVLIVLGVFTVIFTWITTSQWENYNSEKQRQRIEGLKAIEVATRNLKNTYDFKKNEIEATVLKAKIKEIETQYEELYRNE